MRTASMNIGVSLGLVVALTTSGWAEEPRRACPICRSANDQQAAYPQKASSTLVRGAVNTAFGWTELLVQPTEEINEGGNLLVGIGKGVGRAVTRTAAGLGELLTFWAPKGREGYSILAQDCPVCLSATQPGPAKPQHAEPTGSSNAPTR